MKTKGEKVLTIITESIIEKILIQELQKFGISGYTIEDVRGEGRRGLRGSDWDQTSNVRIQVVCDLELAEKISDYLAENYFDRYAMFVFMFDADVFYK